MKHLGLKANGQPLCGGYYLRFISRVYEIELPKLDEPSLGLVLDQIELELPKLDELPKLYLASL